MNKFVPLTVLTLGVLGTLCACGVKPSRVDPPSGVESKPFPSNYPKNISQ